MRSANSRSMAARAFQRWSDADYPSHQREEMLAIVGELQPLQVFCVALSELRFRVEQKGDYRLVDLLAQFPTLDSESRAVLAYEHYLLMRKRNPLLTREQFADRLPSELGREFLEIHACLPPQPEIDATRDALPESIGGVKIDRLLGRGGFGFVYGGTDDDGEQVAVKILDPNVLARQSTEQRDKSRHRFQREAEVLMQGHPGVVKGIRQGFSGVTPYLVMEYVEGFDFDQHLRRTRTGSAGLEWQEAVGLALQVAEVMASLHEKDLIHRDLKPGNLRLCPDGLVKILDFGLARGVGVEHAVTSTGTTMGTPAYMAPDAVKSKYAGKQADIYSVGAVLFFLLTGRPPFTDEPILDGVLYKNAPRPRRYAPEVPVSVEAICLKCLLKNASRRYPSMRDLAADLRRAMSGERIRGKRPSPVTRLLDNPPQLSKPVMSLMAVVAVAVLGAVLWSLVGWTSSVRRAEAVQHLNQVLDAIQPREDAVAIDVPWGNLAAQLPAVEKSLAAAQRAAPDRSKQLSSLAAQTIYERMMVSGYLVVQRYSEDCENALLSLERVASAAEGPLEDLGTLALFRIWLILASQGDLKRADLVRLRLSRRHSLDDQGNSRVVPLSLRQEIADSYRGPDHHIVEILFFDPELVDRRQWTLNAMQYLKAPVNDCFGRQLDLIEALWLADRTDEALEYARLSLAEAARIYGDGPLPQTPPTWLERTIERYSWLLRTRSANAGNSKDAETALEVMGRWWPRSSSDWQLLPLERARVLAALDRRSEARSALEDYIRIAGREYGYYAQAHEMLGFLMEDDGDDPTEVWRQGAFDQWVAHMRPNKEASPEPQLRDQGALSQAHHFLLRSLCHDLTADELTTLISKRLVDQPSDSASASMARFLFRNFAPSQIGRYVQIKDRPGLKAVARRVAFKSTSFDGVWRLPLQFGIREALKIDLERDLTPDEVHLAEWMVVRGLQLRYREGYDPNLGQMILFGSKWMVRSLPTVDELGALPESIRPAVAYLFAVRCRQLPATFLIFKQMSTSVQDPQIEGILNRLFEDLTVD